MAHAGFEGLLTGHTLAGRYRVEEVIGRGGFAAVYRATDERLGRTVAVKVITHSAGAAEVRDEIQKRFQREARAIASLHHPNVVTVYDFGTDPALGLEFLVMELLEGEVLSDRLKRPEPIAVDEALRILRDAAAGVDAGHRAGLVHRDIKPGNVFLARGEHGAAPRVYVVDFGIARFTEPETTQLTHSGRAFLSPAYAAPEQLRGESDVTPAADVFSLGVIGYQLLAREKPFRRDRQHASADAGAAPPPLRERNPAVPAAVASAIHRAMSEDPADRFADAGAFAQALREAAVESPEPLAVYASPPAPGPREEAPRAGAPRIAIPRVDPPPETPSVAAPPVEPPRVASATALSTSPEPARRRRTSPALFAIPVVVVLALAAWLLGRGDGERTRVADRTAPAAAPAPPSAAPGDSTPAAAAPSASAPGASAAGASTAGSTAGPASSAPASSASPSPSPAPAPAVVPTGQVAAPAPPPATAARTSPAASPGGAGAERLNREGEALFEQGDLAGAAARFRRAVAGAPGNAYYRNNLGWALFQLGRIDEAGRELRETVRLDPRRDIAYANIGEVERARGNVAGAIAAYERFLQLNRDPRRAAIAREKLRTLRGG